jgi:hypothetical protein
LHGALCLTDPQLKDKLVELQSQYTADRFFKVIGSTDSDNQPIPDWKRHMLAKKAAEKARKEAEMQLIRDEEQRRMSSIPAWKRQLLNRKDESGR